jgi:hypothetical protein
VHVKQSIILTLKQERFLLHDNYRDRAIDIFTKLIENASTDFREFVYFHILYTLRKKGNSLYPSVKKFLEFASNHRYKKSLLGYGLQILDYLNQFWLEFPEEAALYLIVVFRFNPYLSYDVSHTSTIADLLKKILIDNKGKISNATKKKLVNVLGKLIESNGPGANELMTKVKDT